MNLHYKTTGGLTAKSKRDLQAELRRHQLFPRLYSANNIRHAGQRTQREIDQHIHLIPLSYGDASAAMDAARAEHPRRSNWITPRAAMSNGISIGTIHYKGRSIGWVGNDYTPTIQSFGRAAPDGSMLSATIDGTRYTVRAGRGYRFEADANGLRLVRIADGADHHPDSADIRAGFASMRRRLIDQAVRRAAAARREKLAAREAAANAALIKKALGEVYVSFRDARDAGNCDAGIRSYASRHGLDTRIAHRAATLPERDNNPRVRLATIAATRRWADDIRRGYCPI